MPTTAADLLQAAHAVVPKISAADAQAKVAAGALLLDVRDAPELAANGRAEGSHHIPRGMLEFRAHPPTPFHAPAQPLYPSFLFPLSPFFRPLLFTDAAARSGRLSSSVGRAFAS